MLTIKEEDLYTLLIEEIKYTEYLKNIPLIEKMMINQAIKESNLFIYATRYERHLNDMSVGIYQVLTETMKWLGYKGEIKDMFEVKTQIRYAVQYLDWLYSKFGEIRVEKERVSMMFCAYNIGKGNVNAGLKKGRNEEEIYYEAEKTIQGKWSTYKGLCAMLQKYNIISDRNAEINKRYVGFVMRNNK